MGAPQGGRGWAGGNLIGGIARWVGDHLIGSPSLVVGSQVVTHVAGRPCEVAGRLANPAGASGWSTDPLHAVGRACGGRIPQPARPPGVATNRVSPVGPTPI